MKLPSGALEVSSFIVISPAVAAKKVQLTLMESPKRDKIDFCLIKSMSQLLRNSIS